MAKEGVIRFSADLLASATIEGARHSRSAKQQLDHWARVGREVSAHETASRLRVEAALAGRLPLSNLTPAERTVTNAEIDAAISEQVRAVNVGDVLAAKGLTAVALDEHGRIVRYLADGTAVPVSFPIPRGRTATAD